MNREELQNLRVGAYVQRTFDVEAFTQCETLQDNPRWSHPAKVLRVNHFPNVDGDICAEVETASPTGTGTCTFTTREREVDLRLCDDVDAQPDGACPVCQRRALEGDQTYCAEACAETADLHRRWGGRHMNTRAVTLPWRRRTTKWGHLPTVLALAQTKVREYRTPGPCRYVFATANGYTDSVGPPPQVQAHYRVYRSRVELWEPDLGGPA